MDQNEVLNAVKEYVEFLLGKLGKSAEMTAQFTASDDGTIDKYISVKLVGDDLSDLVGFHGTSMEAIQSILSLMLGKKFQMDLRVLLEVNDYRERREKYLQDVAERAAMDVKSTGQDVELPPMKPYERRMIHMALKSDDQILTESLGEGENRRIVVKLKK